MTPRQHVHPTDHSISHLSLLIAARNDLPQADLLTKLTIFLSTFDSRQIRYTGKAFSTVLGWLSNGALFPVSGSVIVP